tara:strand:+ start:992 stop:2239 length:1248 start_codon:yes stop_codon:yes gene_type:complete
MHNLKLIRNNLENFKKKISERNVKIDFEKLLKLDEENRDLIFKKEKMEKEKKELSKSKNEKNFEKSKNLSSEISLIEKQQNKTYDQINNILSMIPNTANDDVPVGKDEKNNKVIETIGEIRKFDFKIKTHLELTNDSKEIDLDIASKLSGSRFVVLKNKIALLERALINLMLDIHTKKFGYTEISPPLIVNYDVMYGTGQLPKFEEDQFEIKTDDKKNRKFLIPTAEVVLTNLVKDSSIEESKLPLRYVAATPCFRKEAGSYGKDTKGIMRQHQFYKVELVSIVKPSNCNKELERMVDCASEILNLLKLPYRKVLLCTGDMGFSAEKTFDLEVWIPSENSYREISSCSSCGTFQSRRMMAKYKSNKGNDFLGTLNGSGLAIGRLIISIAENYQLEDGKIKIPEILKKYMDNLDKI